jgi:hypothetical protein
MDALDLIKEDHKRLKKLLKETLEAEGSQREHRMDHLRSELVAHERMEEEVLYPRLRDEKKAREEVLEGYEEHHVADMILDERLDVPAETDLWKAKVRCSRKMSSTTWTKRRASSSRKLAPSSTAMSSNVSASAWNRSSARRKTSIN